MLIEWWQQNRSTGLGAFVMMLYLMGPFAVCFWLRIQEKISERTAIISGFASPILMILIYQFFLK